MTTKKECLIYMRTSTLTNVKGDSVKRQKSSIMKWVKSNGYIVKGEYWDVESGSKDTMDRPEFMRMISDSERMGIRVLVFSDQSRLSRDIIVQESTFRLLSYRGYSLVSSENPESLTGIPQTQISFGKYLVPSVSLIRTLQFPNFE